MRPYEHWRMCTCVPGAHHALSGANATNVDVAALTCATVRRRTAAPVSMCVLTPARSRTCPTEPMSTCAPSVRCEGSHERMLASSTEQVGTDMHTHMPSGAP